MGRGDSRVPTRAVTRVPFSGALRFGPRDGDRGMGARGCGVRVFIKCTKHTTAAVATVVVVVLASVVLASVVLVASRLEAEGARTLMSRAARARAASRARVSMPVLR